MESYGVWPFGSRLFHFHSGFEIHPYCGQDQ
jgi:hypothetical protein